jgi:hypothetical protein
LRHRILPLAIAIQAAARKRLSTGFGAVVDWVAFTGVASAAGSLVSAGVFGVAALALANEGKHWRQDRRREDDERRDAERGLASFVSAITESHQPGVAVVVVVNDGEHPVFNVQVASGRGDPPLRRSDGRPPGDVVRRLNPQERISFEFQTLPGEEEFSRPVIDYFDMGGRRWRRRGFNPPERHSGTWDGDAAARPAGSA